MDATVHAALAEICAHGVAGLTLSSLWPKLYSPLSSHGLHLCSSVKTALWTNLLAVPGLQFLSSAGVSYASDDDAIQSFDECERLDLRIVAPEHLRNCFVGVYDIKASDAGISLPQRRVLERLGIARTNGITQSELAKEFGMKGNNIFYILKQLETRGLIVRQSTIVRTKEARNDGEQTNSSIVATNMLHLHRYAKHLGSQQRLEITKEDKRLVGSEFGAGGDGFADECVKEDVSVKDFLPALEAICRKLEKAEGKVLVVSDIKKDLGYLRTSGHRAWRNICHRLKDANVVEEFCAEVNKKKVSCLRLLKKFSPVYFEPKALRCGHDDVDSEQAMKLGKRGRSTDQLVELPIENQIYDMIDAAGSKGLTITEVCKRLGIINKHYYDRILNMSTRFGLHLEAEPYNRGKAYRVWTSGNFNSEALGNQEMVFPKNSKFDSVVACKDFPEDSDQVIRGDCSTNEGNVTANVENENPVIDPEFWQGSPVDGKCNNMQLCPSEPPNSVSEQSAKISDSELQIVTAVTGSSIAPLEMSSSVLSITPRRRSYPRHPCLTLGAISAQRERRILEMLQEEKFLIKPELHRQLESLEKDKQTMMDRKTLDRSLNRLQQQGQCKCIRVSVPVVTNCGRSRTIDVILHPSVQNVSPELLGQIHERLRSFEMQVRSQCSPRVKKGQSLPILDGVQRISSSENIDVQSQKSEAMRANGFVLAKMARTKMLHIFLWGYLSSLPGWDDAISPDKHGCDLNNPHSTWKIFDLDAAIKAMPLELFLQVVGSTHKFEDMIEKCRAGLLLSDLSLQEYKHLMDAQATGRLSWLIDILRRLKLIRLVSDGDLEDVAKVSHATLAHALELKPFIEEPVARVTPSLGTLSVDLRPQIRHDFVLCNRKAVDEYWNTLEYCYAAADSKAALHAFPGSAVHEVFFHRSWVTVRVMTADQRAELLKRVVTDNPNKKLSFKECEKIAKDLNLTLEQVLRVYYDKRQHRLTRLAGCQNMKGEEFLQLERDTLSGRKRKRSSEGKSLKCVKIDRVVEQTSNQKHSNLSDSSELFMEKENNILTPSGKHESDLLEHIEDTEESELNEEDHENNFFLHKCALSRLKPARRSKFSWTENADRQLVIEYVRHRAALGAKFHRADWASLSNLPAPPDTCKRRMAILNSNLQFRKTVMRLCNMLSQRYAKHLEKFHQRSINRDNCKVINRISVFDEGCDGNNSDHLGQTEVNESEQQWDDFNDKNIKIALDEVLDYKRVAKPDPPDFASRSEKYTEVNTNAIESDVQGTGSVLSASDSQDVQNSHARNKFSGRRMSSNRLPRKYIKLLNEGTSVCRQAYESLAVSNAAELFKLIFLSSSRAPEVPTLLAETLRRYSEHDLFAAFNYLREKKTMIGGSGTSTFALSQHFLQSISLSPFPTNTGKIAAKFARWLQEREQDLIEDGVDLRADLECGDVFHLFALITTGELFISPCLPDEGVGDVEESRNLKRKTGDIEFSVGKKAKKLKSSLPVEGEIISRREKGFPGIKLSLSRAKISRIDAVEVFKDEDMNGAALFLSETNREDMTLGPPSAECSSPSDLMSHVLDYRSSTTCAVASSESPWESMKNYAVHLLSLQNKQEESICLDPELFRKVYSVIQKSGDQGLSMKELSNVVNIQGEKMPEIIVEVLEAFGRTLKVNAYDSVHVVDSLYRSKYFLTSLAANHQDVKAVSSGNSEAINDGAHLACRPKDQNDGWSNTQGEIQMNADEVHRVTILNLPEEDAQPSHETQCVNEIQGFPHSKVTYLRGDREGEIIEFCSSSSHSYRPILPWINGDGTINEIVYKGLVRRVLGIVMQNPGILEDAILNQMHVLNPQSCRNLLELMILDNHIIVRKMHQTTSGEAPAIFSGLLGSIFKKSNMVCREHFFSNPMSTSLL